eukprot:SAG11_NODE_5881_length_1442_cov_1.313477_3_plen_76_part_01
MGFDYRNKFIREGIVSTPCGYFGYVVVTTMLYNVCAHMRWIEQNVNIPRDRTCQGANFSPIGIQIGTHLGLCIEEV